jgi:hypothetical protein
VKGRKVPFDSEEEEFLVGGRNYVGPYLVRSAPDVELIRNPNLALEAVISSFHAGKLEQPGRLYPEVVVMEFRHS